MIGMALILLLIVNLCKDHKLVHKMNPSACAAASRESNITTARAATTVREPFGTDVEKYNLESWNYDQASVHPLEVGPLTDDTAWTKPKELSKGDKETNSFLDTVLAVEEQGSYDKQMSQSSCNTSTHTYDKIVAGSSVQRPKPPEVSYSKVLGVQGLYHTMRAGIGQQTPKITFELGPLPFGESEARQDAMLNAQ